MPKIRGIKPEYWTDEDIVELSIAARLLFIGLWNFACDNGHVGDKPKQIKMRIFPGDDVDINELLTELVDHGRITRADGTITILKFAHHQKPHRRWWSTCDLPWCNRPEGSDTGVHNGGEALSGSASPPESNGGSTVAQPGDSGGEPVYDGAPQPLVTSGTTVVQPVAHRRPTADVDCEVDGEGDGDGEATAARQRAANARGTRLPEGWSPTQELVDQMRQEKPHVDQALELRKFRDYWVAATGRNATKRDWPATYRNWIRNARPTNVHQLPRGNTDIDWDAAFARADQRDQENHA